MPNRNQYLIGKVFGHLTVVHKSSRRGSNGQYYWDCKCDCGKMMQVATSSLNSGHITSCGHIKQKNLVPSDKRHSSQLGEKPPINSSTGYRNISKTFRSGRWRYRVAVMYNRRQYGGLRDTLKEALALREELREKHWPKYKK